MTHIIIKVESYLIFQVDFVKHAATNVENRGRMIQDSIDVQVPYTDADDMLMRLHYFHSGRYENLFRGVLTADTINNIQSVQFKGVFIDGQNSGGYKITSGYRHVTITTPVGAHQEE